MPFQPCPNTIEVNLQQLTWKNETIENIFHVYLANATALSQGNTDTLSAAIAGSIDDIKAYIFSGNSFERIIATDIRTEGAAQYVSTSGFPVAGTSGADPLPGQNALLVSWFTGFRGKSGRGRSYFGGLTEAAITSGVATPGLVTAAEEMADDLINDLNMPLGVLSRFKDGSERAEGVIELVQARKVATQIATQRRRRLA